jgi:hypothetical protein
VFGHVPNAKSQLLTLFTPFNRKIKPRVEWGDMLSAFAVRSYPDIIGIRLGTALNVGGVARIEIGVENGTSWFRTNIGQFINRGRRHA